MSFSVVDNPVTPSKRTHMRTSSKNFNAKTSKVEVSTRDSVVIAFENIENQIANIKSTPRNNPARNSIDPIRLSLSTPIGNIDKNEPSTPTALQKEEQRRFSWKKVPAFNAEIIDDIDDDEKNEEKIVVEEVSTAAELQEIILTPRSIIDEKNTQYVEPVITSTIGNLKNISSSDNSVSLSHRKSLDNSSGRRRSTLVSTSKRRLSINTEKQDDLISTYVYTILFLI